MSITPGRLVFRGGEVSSLADRWQAEERALRSEQDFGVLTTPRNLQLIQGAVRADVVHFLQAAYQHNPGVSLIKSTTEIQWDGQHGEARDVAQAAMWELALGSKEAVQSAAQFWDHINHGAALDPSVEFSSYTAVRMWLTEMITRALSTHEIGGQRSDVPHQGTIEANDIVQLWYESSDTRRLHAYNEARSVVRSQTVEVVLPRQFLERIGRRSQSMAA